MGSRAHDVQDQNSQRDDHSVEPQEGVRGQGIAQDCWITYWYNLGCVELRNGTAEPQALPIPNNVLV